MRLNVCVFSNTIPLVYAIDASVKVTVNGNVDNNTTTSANVCTHIFISILLWALVSGTVSVFD